MTHVCTRSVSYVPVDDSCIVYHIYIIGMVGTHMLTAAVCGEIFASPSVAAVLAGIRALTPNQVEEKDDIDRAPSSESGCLMVVKNYTGDRINFRVAQEIAEAEVRKKKQSTPVIHDIV